MNIDEDETMTITLKNEFGSYQISSTEELAHIDDFRDSMLIPLLLAMGYQQDNVHELFGLEEEEPAPQNSTGLFNTRDDTWTTIVPEKVLPVRIGSNFKCINENEFCDIGEVFELIFDKTVHDRVVAMNFDGDIYDMGACPDDVYDITPNELNDIFGGDADDFVRIP